MCIIERGPYRKNICSHKGSPFFYGLLASCKVTTSYAYLSLFQTRYTYKRTSTDAMAEGIDALLNRKNRLGIWAQRRLLHMALHKYVRMY